MNLRGEIREGRLEFMPPERALESLREWAGQDFGMDAQAWEAWGRTNTKEFRGKQPGRNAKPTLQQPIARRS
jgi:hypothetical protein